MGWPHIASGAIRSGDLGITGGVPTGTNFLRDDFQWASPGAASVSSGAVTQITFGSGAGPEYLMGFVSGLNNPFSVITQETISGVRAVSISQSGNIQIAMAGTSGRMPAVGVVLDNVTSGIQCNVYTFGDFQLSSGLADYSGYVGRQLFVGRSGQIVSASGSFNSGGLLSGDVTQPIGTSLNSGAIQLAVATNLPIVLGLISSGMLASGNISQFDIASGAINSGQVASGAIQGFFGGTRDIASGTVGVFDFGSGAVIAGTVGSGAVVSGNIASGQVGHFAVAANAITSGQIGSGAAMGQQGGGPFNIASGTLGKFDLSSGIITSGVYIGSGTILGQAGGGPFNIASGTISTNDIGSGAIQSGNLASGQVGSNALASGIITSGNWLGSGSVYGQIAGGIFIIASGSISTNDIGSGQVQSGNILSGNIAFSHLSSGAVRGASPAGGPRHILSGSIGSVDVASGVLVGNVGVGIGVRFHLASGSLDAYNFASGALADRSQYVLANASGLSHIGPAITEEIVSGVRAVTLSASGNIRVAMASVAARMPAIGVVVENVASGIPANVFVFGQFQFTSGLADYSGYVGTSLFVGRSGQVVTTSGSFNSGGLLSGDVYQPIGYAFNSGAAMLQVDAPAISGGPPVVASGGIGSGAIASGAVQGFFGPTRDIASGTVGVFDFGSGAVIAGTVGSGAIQSGNIASGQIGNAALASGSITSGVAIGSGAIWGRAGVNQFMIASGTIQGFDIASGGVLSGNIASGQIGQKHLSSGIITSGVYIGSGTILGQAGGGPFNIASGTITGGDIGSGAVQSGHIASGQVANFAVGSGAVTSGRIAMGGTPNGTLFFRDDYTWQTAGGGSVTSGSIIQIDFASGTGIEFLMPVISGLTTPFPIVTEETVSGVRAVSLSQSGHLRIAKASVSGTMPAIGVVVDNVLSGLTCNVFADGLFQFNSGLADYSGWVGTSLYVGRSGQIVSLSGSFNSGGIQSGDITQLIGTAANSGAALIQVGEIFHSGFFLGSGVAGSGSIASGAIQGFFGPTRDIASGTVGVFDFGSGAVIAGTIGSGAVQSGNIASGQIGINHLASGAIVSGWAIGSGTLYGRLGPEFLIASGTIGTFDLSSGIITSGVYIGSGTIMGHAGGGPFQIVSGSVTTADIGSGAILSGQIGSGQIGDGHFGSGAGPQYLYELTSGLNNGLITEETVSGIRAVCFTTSGHVKVAMASQSGRMPAVGIVFDNVASGIQCNVFAFGNFTASSGLADYSGYLGQNLWVGRSGQIVTTSGSFNSGGLLSGDVWQPVGTAWLTSGGISVAMAAQMSFTVGQITSGNIASGQIGSTHIASGGVLSGNIGSGQVGTYALASGNTETNARNITPLWSGNAFKAAISSEAISGIKAVCVDITNSGSIRTAMAATSGRMPAIGVVADNILSGIPVNVISMGYVPFGSGIMGSGYLQGKAIWVGHSGDLITLSGGYGSGGSAVLSGFMGQQMGSVHFTASGRTSGAYLINTSQVIYSGIPLVGQIPALYAVNWNV